MSGQPGRPSTDCWYCRENAKRSVVYRLRPARYSVGTEAFACSMHLAATVERMAEPGGWVPVTKLAPSSGVSV